MSHLSTDRLAALGDEPPTAAEAAHLAACAECTRERNAYRALVAMAHAERAAIALPLTRWDSIAAALAAEESPVPVKRTPPRIAARATPRWPLQVAAGLLLVAGGAVLGRIGTGDPALPGGSASAPPSTATAPAATAAAPAGNTTASPATRLAADTEFASIEEARAAQARSELLYQQAAAYLAQHDAASLGDDSPGAYRSRLAALDRVISTTREALREAPHDPVINGYYLTTINQRDATLRQLNTTLPASLRLGRF